MAWWGKQSAQTAAGSLEDYHTAFAATLKEQIEQGVAPWQQSWKPGARRLPEHLVSGNAYRGVNALHLSVGHTAKGYRDNRWATATQIQALGGQVRPGEQATPVLVDTVDDERQAQQPPGAPDTGQPPGGEQDHEQTRPPMVRVHAVFNVEQADGLSADDRDQKSKFETHELAERVIWESGIHVAHVHGDRAFYNMHTDKVTLPEREPVRIRGRVLPDRVARTRARHWPPRSTEPRHAQERHRGFRQRGVRPRRTARRNSGDADRRAGRRRPRREPWRAVRAGLAHGAGTRPAGNRQGRRRGATHVGLPAAPGPRARTGDRAERRRADRQILRRPESTDQPRADGATAGPAPAPARGCRRWTPSG